MKQDTMPVLEFVGWEEFHQLCFELAGKLAPVVDDVEIMVSVSRGGHVISRILSDLLDLEIYNVSISSYETINRQKEMIMKQKLGFWLEGKSILLVDEIVDSGGTLKRAVAYVKRIKIKQVRTVCLHVKPQTIMWPDFAVKQTSNWVVYPYEVRETIESLMPWWDKAGMKKKERIEMLVRGGMKRQMVEAMYQQSAGKAERV